MTFAAGTAGALGLALAAARSHGSEDARLLATAAQILLPHASALLAMSARFDRVTLVPRAVPALVVVGLGLFCGDLIAREFLARPLFPYAAPLGGATLIGGWLGLSLFGVAAALSTSRRS